MTKSLCLVLALVLVLGLCTVGASAYTDDAKIEYGSAVTVLTGLEVIDGYEDGSFKPAENVTRAEAAAMITRMMLGRGNAEKLPAGGSTKFEDVAAGAWYAKYVSFCANRGIIVGTSDTTFNPSGLVTGTQLATMLLRALGYGKMGEYEGSGWDINAISDALTYGLLDDSRAADFAAPATREECALYVFNTLDVTEVGFDVDYNIYLDRTDALANPITFGSQIFKLADWASRNLYPMLTENQATGADYTVIGGRNYAVETGLDLIGHEVNIYYKDVVKTDRDGNNYYEAYVVDDLSTVLDKGTYYGDMYKNLIAANKANKNINLSTIPVYNNYDLSAGTVGVTITDYDNNTVYTTVADLQGQYSSKDLTSFYITGTYVLDHEGKILCVLTTSSTVGQVTAVTEDGISVKDSAAVVTEYANTLAYDGIKKGDYVVIEPVGELTYLNPTSTQEVTITQRTDYSMFGMGYFFNNNAISPGSGLGINAASFDSPAAVRVGDKVKFYVQRDFGFGGMFSYFGLQILEAGTADGVVFVNDYYSVNSTDEYGTATVNYRMQAVNEKGEIVVYPMTSAAYAANQPNGPGVYTVYLNSKGAVSTLVQVPNSRANKMAGKASSVSIGAGDIYFVQNDTDVFYVTGIKANAKVTASKTLASGAYTVYMNPVASGRGYAARTIWISTDATGISAPVATASSYLFVNGTTYSANYIALNGSEYVAYTMYVDGEEISGSVTSASTIFDAFGGLSGGFYTYSINSIGQYVLTPFANVETVTLDGASATIRNGRLYTANVDGRTISNAVADVSSGTTSGTKTDANVNSIERIEELLNDGYSITISYAYTNGSTFAPVGTIYVTGVVAP